MIADEVGLGFWLFGKSMLIDANIGSEHSKVELKGLLTQVNNPLDPLDNPLIRQITEVAKLIRSMEGKR